MSIQYLQEQERVFITKDSIIQIVAQQGELYDSDASTWRHMGRFIIHAKDKDTSVEVAREMFKAFLIDRFHKDDISDPNFVCFFGKIDVQLSYAAIIGAVRSPTGIIKFTVDCDMNLFFHLLESVKEEFTLFAGGDATVGAVSKHVHQYFIFK